MTLAAEPPTQRRIILNGKFLSAESTGVHRVAEELILASHEVLRATPELAQRLHLDLWVPRDAVDRARRLGLPYRVVGPLRGIPWEQFTLPLRASRATVLNLCNVGPVVLRDAVTMFHDAQVHSSPRSYGAGFRTWYRFHQPLAGRRHQLILTVSEYSRQQIAHYGLAPLSKVHVVHNGVDHMLRLGSEASVLSRLALQPGRYVVALANTQVHKNVPILLKAFASPALSDITLVLFGGATRQAFEAAGHQVPGNCLFAGRVTDSQLRHLYEQALCMAFPSLTEGFGLPPLEAMTLGCPAVVAPCGALPEVCGAAAVYADAADTSAWVSAIRRLADNPDARAERSAAGRQWAARFTWRASAERMLRLLAAV